MYLFSIFTLVIFARYFILIRKIKALNEKYDCHFESTVHYSVSHPMIVEVEAAEQTEDGEDDKDEDKITKDNLKQQKLSAHEDEEFLPCNGNIMSMNTKNRL